MKDLAKITYNTATGESTPWAICNKCASSQPTDHMMLADGDYHMCEDCFIALAHDLCWGTKLDLIANHPENLAPTSDYMTIADIRNEYRKEEDHD